MLSPCARCAQAGSSCCQGYQILLTSGDIRRIADVVGHYDFLSIEPPVIEEIAPDYDPQWLPLILEPDQTVRVLRRSPEKRCSLLTETGCQLPWASRPLICRLYPYTYTEQGILGIDPACPISKTCEWTKALDGMDMPAAKAKEWLTLLYAEVHARA